MGSFISATPITDELTCNFLRCLNSVCVQKPVPVHIRFLNDALCIRQGQQMVLTQEPMPVYIRWDEKYPTHRRPCASSLARGRFRLYWLSMFIRNLKSFQPGDYSQWIVCWKPCKQPVHFRLLKKYVYFANWHNHI